MILTAATLWGLNGTVAQFVFGEGVQPGTLVTIRMLGSGLVLLLLGLLQKDANVFNVWKSPVDRRKVIIFGLVGILGSQYTFFVAIEQGNAAAAALLQYMGPLFIMLYVAFKLRKMPSGKEFIALFLAIGGTCLLVTNGSFDSLNIPLSAVIWGLSSAVTLAVYTLYPVKLLNKWGSVVVVGWGMVVGGISLSFIDPPWEIVAQISSPSTYIYILFIVIFGTLVPYYLFIDSLRFIQPTEASIIACAEPLAAVIVSILWLHVPFGFMQSLGGLSIIIAVLLLVTKRQTNSTIQEVGYGES